MAGPTATHLANALVSILLLTVPALAETRQCREFPDGDPQTVQVENNSFSEGFVSTLPFDEKQLAYAVCGANLYYIQRSGRSLRAFNYDNGPDYFSEKEGLARFIAEDGLIGYTDTNLKIVIPAQFHDAFPFRDGAAKVLVTIDGVRTWAFVDSNGSISIEEQ